MTQIANLPFSKIRIANGLAFLSGELPLEANGSIPEGIEAQTHLVLARIAATLEEAGLTLGDVVSATVYLTDKTDFAGFNQAYREHFQDPLPVRTTVCCDLVLPARLEISVVAATRS
ncbi:RidA family protein [Cupriavidus sp. 2TAF22]|uniref:RidA family protein n=1 Tax=unclassified Cupriavidus TaxID=2640874 RepID=UPI003F91DDC8